MSLPVVPLDSQNERQHRTVIATTLNELAKQYNVLSLTESYAGWYRADHALHDSLTNCLIGYQSYDDSAATLTGTIGYRCTAFGVLALSSNGSSVSAGGSNTAVGYSALRSSVESSGNTMVGGFAGDLITGVNSSHNTGVGYRTQSSLTAGTQNTSIGFQTLDLLDDGDNNVAIGDNALSHVTVANGNIGIGVRALYNKGTGDNSVAIGLEALFNETTAVGNTALGFKAGTNVTDQGGNTFVGYNVASANEAGQNNTGIGFEALFNVNTAIGGDQGEYNTAVGYWSGRGITSGGSCALLGQQSGRFITTGSETVGIGANSANGVTTAIRGVFVGSSTGVNLNGANNTAIGYNASSVGSAQTYTNVTCLGANSVPTGSNQVVLGDTNVTVIRAQVTTITALSDRRFKENIRPLDIPDAALDEIEIVVFDWIAGAKDQVGVIAQQLDAWQDKWNLQWLGLVDKSNPDRLEATPGKLLFPLIVKTQRLAKRVAALEAKNGQAAA